MIPLLVYIIVANAGHPGPVTDLVSMSPIFYEQLLRMQIPKAQKDSQVVSLLCAFGICGRKIRS